MNAFIGDLKAFCKTHRHNAKLLIPTAAAGVLLLGGCVYYRISTDRRKRSEDDLTESCAAIEFVDAKYSLFAQLERDIVADLEALRVSADALIEEARRTKEEEPSKARTTSSSPSSSMSVEYRLREAEERATKLIIRIDALPVAGDSELKAARRNLLLRVTEVDERLRCYTDNNHGCR